jgi:hypothetical protein
MGGISRTHSDSVISLVNDSETNCERITETMQNPQHQFSDYLRAKAATIHDVGLQQTLNVVADAFDDFQKQAFLKDETSVVTEQLEEKDTPKK